MASGVFNLHRTLAGAVGVALTATVMEYREDVHTVAICRSAKRSTPWAPRIATATIREVLRQDGQGREGVAQMTTAILHHQLEEAATLASYHDLFLLFRRPHPRRSSLCFACAAAHEARSVPTARRVGTPRRSRPQHPCPARTSLPGRRGGHEGSSLHAVVTRRSNVSHRLPLRRVADAEKKEGLADGVWALRMVVHSDMNPSHNIPYEIDSPSKGISPMADTALIVANNLSHNVLAHIEAAKNRDRLTLQLIELTIFAPTLLGPSGGAATHLSWATSTQADRLDAALCACRREKHGNANRSA